VIVVLHDSVARRGKGSCFLNSKRYDFFATPDEVVEVTMAGVLGLIAGPSGIRTS
jgi:hypothetical protein